MPKHVAKTRYLAINGTAISDHCMSITIQDQADQVEITSFTANSYKEYAQGFRDATITADIFADFDAAQTHAILQPLYSTGGTFLVEVREDSTNPVSATNPKATMTARLYEYSPISGAVGAAATFQAAFRNAGTSGLVWGTS